VYLATKGSPPVASPIGLVAALRLDAMIDSSVAHFLGEAKCLPSSPPITRFEEQHGFDDFDKASLLALLSCL
jgi:hypothetical protein